MKEYLPYWSEMVLNTKAVGTPPGETTNSLGLAVLRGGLVIVALHGVGQQVDDVVQQHQGAHDR